MERECITVCLCAYNVDECVLPLHEISSGHVFGPRQHLRLLLHGKDRESLDDLVLYVQESCYHLVDEVFVAPTIQEQYDATVVLLPQNSLSCNFNFKTESSNAPVSANFQATNSLSSYIVTLSNFLESKITDTSKILVLGHGANVAATLLSRRLRCVGGNQLLAFPIHENTRAAKRSQSRNQYKTTDILCNTISKWWAGRKDTSMIIKAGIKFFDKRSVIPIQDGGVFLTVPVGIVGQKSFNVDPISHIDTDELIRVVGETEKALCEMKDVVPKNENTSHFHSQL